jgi:hypothetical protein
VSGAGMAFPSGSDNVYWLFFLCVGRKMSSLDARRHSVNAKNGHAELEMQIMVLNWATGFSILGSESPIKIKAESSNTMFYLLKILC